MQTMLPPRWFESASGGEHWCLDRCRSVSQAEGLSKTLCPPLPIMGPSIIIFQAPFSLLKRACSPAASQVPLTLALPWCNTVDVSKDTPDLPGH